MSLASIQSIAAVRHHSNADSLDIATVRNYEAIVKRDQWKVGDLCVFIEPDSVLPDQPWAAFYKAKSNRVKAIRLRSSWSFGIIESPLALIGPSSAVRVEVGADVTEFLGITKYEAPAPQDLAASGPYGFGIPKTDEEKWQGIERLPFGEKVDVTLKIDGQSWSALCVNEWSKEAKCMVMKGSIGGRSFLYKLDSDNNYTRNERTYGVLAKLEAFCRKRHRIQLAIRAEQYGLGIQKGAHNPHSKLPLGLAFFSSWLIDERRYATKGHPLYVHTIAAELALPTVPMLERDVVLTPELIKHYSEGLETITLPGGAPQPFEGVVINHAGGSFKVINLHYDSRK